MISNRSINYFIHLQLNFSPVPAFHLHRVANLSGTCRILESLYTNPLPGKLMESALMRTSDDFVAAVDVKDVYQLNQLRPDIFAKLNLSQRRAVATICSPSFTKGFFLVQGPPG